MATPSSSRSATKSASPKAWTRPGGRFLIILVPSKEELYGAEAFQRPAADSRGEGRAGIAGASGPVPLPPFREFGRERPQFYRADMHLNALGNQIVANALAKWSADQHIFTALLSAPTVAVAAPTK